MIHTIRQLSIRATTACAVCGLLGLTGCGGQFDPLTREYAWHPTQVNASNIAAMAVRPADLSLGRHTDTRPAQNDADAAERAITGKLLPLGNSGGGSGGGLGGGLGGGNTGGGS